jgi:glycosyltransferase involved in cell wall biosynthesis
VIVGNWNNSAYGRNLKDKYGSMPNMHLLDPIYDVGALRALRTQASVYVHGHSAGGTNPSLVEAMQFGVPILAFDCSFNRETTEGKAIYFRNADDLSKQLRSADRNEWRTVGKDMLEIGERRYKWSTVAEQYFHLFLKDAK